MKGRTDSTDLIERLSISETTYSLNGKTYRRPGHELVYLKTYIGAYKNTYQGSRQTIGQMIQGGAFPESTRLPTAFELFMVQDKKRKPLLYAASGIPQDFVLKKGKSVFSSEDCYTKAGEEIRFSTTLLVTPKGYEGGKYDEAIFEKTGKKKYPRIVVENFKELSGLILVPEGRCGMIASEWNENFGIPSETEESQASEDFLKSMFLFDPEQKEVVIGYSVLEIFSDDELNYISSTDPEKDTKLNSLDPSYRTAYAINALNSPQKNIMGESSKTIIQPVFSELHGVEEVETESRIERPDTTSRIIPISSDMDPSEVRKLINR